MARLVQLVDGVFVATSAIEQQTTTVVAADDGACLVVDAGVTPDEMAELASDLAELGLRPVAAFSTHGHWRHALWHESLGDVPHYATSEAAAWSEAHRGDLEGEMQEAALGLEASHLAKLTPLEEGAESLDWDGTETVIGPLAAHSSGHAGLLFPGIGLLVAGDTCSDVQFPVLDLSAEEPLDDYRTVLDVLAGLDMVTHVVPGHGTPADAEGMAERLAADERYLAALIAGEAPEDERLTNASPLLLARHEEQARRFAPGEAGKEPSGPIVVEIPDEMMEHLQAVTSALDVLASSSASYLQANHLDVAAIAEALQPVASASDLAASESQAALWNAPIDAELAALQAAVSLASAARDQAAAYLARLKEIFANAIVPEPPDAGEGGETSSG